MFQGRVAVITGGSSGIGLAVAEKLVRAGAMVALVARTKATLDEVVARLGAGSAHAFPLDVCNLEALVALPGQVIDRFGRLDYVVNNAGVNHRGSIAKHTPLELAEIVTTNLTSAIVLTRAAFPRMEREGAVVQVASIAGMVPVPGEATYSASKAGMRAFARAVAEDLAERDIHSGCVCPGPVDTGFFGDIDTVPDVVFSQPMSSADQIADGVLECIRTRKAEIVIPRQSGRLATAAYLMPALARRLQPSLEKRGKEKKAAYVARKKRP